ncbi:hypothetical protein KKH39_03465 [Patescibacteria group bacterium]|nr:hypothetical protein [Patescibacteria group bacterium]
MKVIHTYELLRQVGTNEELSTSINLVHIMRILRDVRSVIGPSCTVEMLANYLEDLSEQALIVRQRLLDNKDQLMSETPES